MAEYVGRSYKYGGDIHLAVEGLMLPKLTEPKDLTKPANQDSAQDLGEGCRYICQQAHLPAGKCLHSILSSVRSV
jgi:hypothetical protein